MNFTSSEMDFVKENEAYRPIPESDKRRLESSEAFDAEICTGRISAVLKWIMLLSIIMTSLT